MNLNHVFTLGVVSSALLLTACGGDSSSSSASSTEDEHNHESNARLLIAETNDTALTIFDQADEQFEALGNAAALGASLVRSDDGLSAAVVTSSGVQFVFSGLHEEDGEEEDGEHTESHAAEILDSLTLTASDVTVSMTHNHFAVLNAGDTLLYPAGSLEEATAAEDTLTFTDVTQTYPAAILDEEHEMFLVFANGTATVYEAGEATEHTIACANPSAVALAHELTLAQCGTELVGVVMEEVEEDSTAASGALDNEEEHSIEIMNIALDGMSVAGLVSNGEVALINDTGAQSSTVSWNDDTESVDVTAVTLEGDADLICAIQIATADATAGILTNDNQLHFLNVSDDTVSRISLDDSDSDACADWNLTSGAQSFAALDNDAGLMYYVDSHDGSSYHIHERFDVPEGTSVSSAAWLHSVEAEDDHDHDH